MRRNLLLLILSSLFAVGVAEVFLRVFDLATTTGVYTVTEAEFQRIPGLLAPGLSIIDTRGKPELPHKVSINSLGYRGEEFPIQKHGQEFRIFFAGDSFVYGDYVDDDETLPFQLQQSLRQQCPDVRVVNGGIDSSTITEQSPMIDRSMVLSPDLIILMFYENDVMDLARVPSMWEQFRSNREIKSRFPMSWIYPVIRHSAVWNLTLEAYRSWQSRTTSAGNMPNAGPRDGMNARRKQYVSLLAELFEKLERAQVPLLLVIFPSHSEFTSSLDQGSAALEWIESEALTLGIPTVNLLTALRASNADVKSLYLVPIDGHASPFGYSVAAHALAEYLVAENGLIPDICGRT